MTIRALFDGEKIIIPKELAGHEPCEVEILLPDDVSGSQLRESLWDVVLRAKGERDSAGIISELSADRDSWES